MKKQTKTEATVVTTRAEARINHLRAMGFEGEIPQDEKELGRLIHERATQIGTERAPIAREVSIRNLRAMGFEGEIPQDRKELGKLVNQVALSVATNDSPDPLKFERSVANLRAMGYQGDIPQDRKELGKLVNQVALAANQQKESTAREVYQNLLWHYANKGYGANLGPNPTTDELKNEVQRLAALVAKDRENAPASEGQQLHAQRLGIELGNASFAEARKILGAAEVNRRASA